MAKAMKAATNMSNNEKLGVATKEQRFQNKIERYQIANAKADYELKSVIARAAKFFNGLRKTDKALSDNEIKPLSNYSHLAKLWKDLGLAKFDEKSFAAEAAIRIGNDLDKSVTGHVSDAQANVIREYHENWAKKNLEVVNSIRIVLTQKGFLKGAEAYDLKKLELVLKQEETAGKNDKAKMPTAAEVAKDLKEVAA